jgi:hypothetical protein
MNKFVSGFAKFAACFAFCTGAPLAIFSVVNFTVDTINSHLEFAACEKTAALDKVKKECR